MIGKTRVLNLSRLYNQKSKPSADNRKIVKSRYVHDLWKKPFFRLHSQQLYLKPFAKLFFQRGIRLAQKCISILTI